MNHPQQHQQHQEQSMLLQGSSFIASNLNDNELRRAAIALNNVAVSLLVRGFCRDAADTFSEAIRFIVLVHNHIHTPALHVDMSGLNSDIMYHDHSSDVVTSQEIQRALDNASRRTMLSDQLLSRHPQTKDDGGKLKKHWPKLEVISSQGRAIDIYNTLTTVRNKDDLSIAFPVKLDPIDNTYVNEDMIRFECAVILYNFGIFHDCLAVTSTAVRHFALDSPEGHARATIQAKAHHLYKWVNALLCAPPVTPESTTCAWIKSRYILLQTTLMHNLIGSSIKLRLADEYRGYCHTIANLMYAIEAHHSMMPTSDRILAAAA